MLLETKFKISTTPCFSINVYTKDSYKNTHDGRDPEKDGLKPQLVLVPGHSNPILGYRAPCLAAFLRFH